jgi:hypothetical protein
MADNLMMAFPVGVVDLFIQHQTQGSLANESQLFLLKQAQADYQHHTQVIKAVARKMARIIFALFKNRTAYDRTKLDQPKSGKAIARITDKLAKQAQKLEYVLIPAKPQVAG